MSEPRFSLRQVFIIAASVITLILVVLFTGSAIGYRLGRAEEQALDQDASPTIADAFLSAEGLLDDAPLIGGGLALPRPLPSECDIPSEFESTIPKAFLGVRFRSIDEDFAGEENLNVNEGALIIEIVKNSMAAKAGLRVDDIVTAVDDKPINLENNLRSRIAEYMPGDLIELSVQRADETIRVDAILAKYADMSSLELTLPRAYLGVSIESITADLVEEESLSANRGVLIREVDEDSAAAKAGLLADDIITALDGEPLETADALVKHIAEREPGDSIVLSVLHGGEELRVNVTLGTRSGRPKFQFRTPDDDDEYFYSRPTRCSPRDEQS